MGEPRAIALQMCLFYKQLEAGLNARFKIVRWFELGAAEQAACLRQRASAVRAVVTGDHVGCSNALMATLPALGIVGLGQIGSTVAARLAAFGSVAYTGPQLKPVPYIFHEDVLALAKATDVLDVFENEPHVPAALRAHDRVVLTPHMASATVETRLRMAEVVLESLDAFIGGLALPTAVI